MKTLTLKQNWITQWALAILSAILFLPLGCRTGGGITIGASLNSADPPKVAVPSISIPLSNPYYSREDNLTLMGMCMTDDTVELTGDASEEQPCNNSTYSFNVNKTTDGFYFFSITQKNSAGNSSSPANLIWIRKTSVASPHVLYPPRTPYPSAEDVLTIYGDCETGAQISLSGDGSGSTVCTNSHFSLSLPKAADGSFNLTLTQTDSAENSATSSLVWNKQALQASPTNPTLLVGSQQVFTIIGGTPPYTLTLKTNLSGGALNSSTLTYTLGSYSGVTDVIEVKDTLNFKVNLNVTSFSGVQDHLVATQGDLQSTLAGTAFNLPIKVQVVDQFGNGIPNIPLLFQVTRGDLKLQGPAKQSSDAQGFVQIGLTAGLSTLRNLIRVTSGTPLLDNAGTGNTSLTFTETVTTLGNGSLGPSTPTGNSPGATLKADFNQDGKLDAAVVSQDDNKVSIFLGKGDGFFQPKVQYTTCTGPTQIASADLNEDGNLDLIVTCPGSNRITVLLGNSDGTFSAPSSFLTTPLLSTPVAIRTADFDGDHHIDLAVASSGNSSVGIYYGRGDGTFITPTTSQSVGLYPVDMLVSDVNQDGKPDLVLATSGDSALNVLMNLGSQTFAPNASYSLGDTNPITLAAADINGDNFPDLAVLMGGGNSVSLFLNTGTGQFPSAPSSSISVGNVGATLSSMSLVDVDGDSYPDLLIGNTGDSSIGLLLGHSDGTFSDMTVFPNFLSPMAITAADFNGDGKKDLLITSAGGTGANTLQFLPGYGIPGSTLFGFVTSTGINPTRGVSADFDGDGKPDLAVIVSGNHINLFKGLGNGTFQPLQTLTTNINPSSIRAQDLNGDQKIDLIVTQQGSASIGVFINNGDGTFQPRVDYAVGPNPNSIAIADFNGNGFVDLAVTTQANGGKISILLGAGDGTFGAIVNGSFQVGERTDLVSGSAPNTIISEDFNGDSFMDLAVLNSTDTNVGILLGNGNGTFRPMVTYPVGQSPTAMIAGDFNGHGRVDLVVSNSTDGTLTLLQGDGNGAFPNQLTYSAGGQAGDLIVGDFNKDNKLDIAVANNNTNSFNLLLGQTGGGLNAPQPFITNGTANSIILGDFNQDGALDIAVTDGTNNQVQIFMGQQ